LNRLWSFVALVTAVLPALFLVTEKAFQIPPQKRAKKSSGTQATKGFLGALSWTGCLVGYSHKQYGYVPL